MAKKKEESAAPVVNNTNLSSLDEFISEQFDGIKKYSKEESSVKKWYDWGNYALNYICSKNLFKGAPVGRIVSLKGLSGSGKSLLYASLGKDPNIDMIITIEAEGAGFTPELFQFAGGDVNKLRRIRASTWGNYKISKKDGTIKEVVDEKFPKEKKETEEFIYYEGVTRQVKKLINKIEMGGIQANILIVLDSIANVQSVRERSGTPSMGKNQQDINIFFRTFDNTFERTNILFGFTNKLYKNFGDIYNPYIESGGETVSYNPSLSLLLRETAETDDLSDAEIKAEKERRKTALGSSIKTIKVTVDKSRFGTEYRNISFLIDFSTGGIFKYSGLFSLCKDFGIIQRSGSTYTLDGVIDGSFYKKDFIKIIATGGMPILEKIQNKLEEAEELIKQNKMKLQEIVDVSIEEEDDEYEQTELINQMSKDLNA
jgi:hypothetical protein